jgi:hypothetical protein
MSNPRKSTRHAEVAIVAALIVLALAARWAGGREITDDMKIFFQWYNQLKRAGGWPGLGWAPRSATTTRRSSTRWPS